MSLLFKIYKMSQLCFDIGPSWCPRSSWPNRKSWKKGMVVFHCVFWRHQKSSLYWFLSLCSGRNRFNLVMFLALSGSPRCWWRKRNARRTRGKGQELLHLYIQILYVSSPLKILWFNIKFLMKEYFTLKLHYTIRLGMWMTMMVMVTMILQGDRGFDGLPGLPGDKGHRVRYTVLLFYSLYRDNAGIPWNILELIHFRKSEES